VNPVPSLPPRLAAATERPARLAGAPVSMTAVVPRATRRLLADAVRGDVRPPSHRRSRIYLNVEDIRADANPGSVYGVYLNLPASPTERDRDHHHVGNVTVFGIEAMNAADPRHEHVPGMRHTFDVTRRVRTLWRSGRFDRDDRVVVTFLLELPLPPPGFRGDADRILGAMVHAAAAAPITIGRVSVFVG
jgi:tyrosinase